MTTPSGPPPEEPVQPPPPQSPQAVETEAALAAAESQLVPIIVGILLAAAIADAAVPDGDIEDGLSGVVARGALFTPAWVANTFAKGTSDVVIGTIKMILHPLILRRLHSMKYMTVVDDDGPAFHDIADESADYAIREAIRRMHDYAADPRARATSEIYDLFDGPDDDPRTTAQRRAEAFARRTARWVAREGVFRGQAVVAKVLGYTHKRWLTVGDERVRYEHTELDSEVVRINEKFYTPTGRISYPGDISAPPHLVINCRCSLEWLKR